MVKNKFTTPAIEADFASRKRTLYARGARL